MKESRCFAAGLFHELASLAAGGLVDFAEQNLGASPLAIVCTHRKALAGRQAFAALRLCPGCSLMGQTERGLQSAQFSLFYRIIIRFNYVCSNNATGGAGFSLRTMLFTSSSNQWLFLK